MISQRDKVIVRELAKKYMELVATERQERMLQRMRDTNDLKLVRPPVILDEIPWGQMNLDGELDLFCEDAEAKRMELHFKKALLYLKHFRADNLFEPFFRVARAVHSTGIGVEMKVADVRCADESSYVVSREYADVFADESILERLHDPVYTTDPEEDARKMELCTDILGNSIPIRQYGFGFLYHAPWDLITRMRGVEPIMIDMYDRPEYLHAIMKKYISAANAQLDFIEKNLDVDPEITSLHCTPAKVSGLAPTGLGATWFRGMAQSFGIVSPAMFKEFEVDYIKPLAERFGYTYYGCCEPLDDKIEVLKEIRNLRKLGCSPWANVEACAEQIGGNYVLSRKPNPANVAIRTDPEVIRREIEETVRVCQKHGCPFDYVLKDISTVSGRPENLILWAQTVSDVLDRYYDAR